MQIFIIGKKPLQSVLTLGTRVCFLNHSSPLLCIISSALLTAVTNKNGKMARSKIHSFMIKSPQETVGEIPWMRQKHIDLLPSVLLHFRDDVWESGCVCVRDGDVKEKVKGHKVNAGVRFTPLRRSWAGPGWWRQWASR